MYDTAFTSNPYYNCSMFAKCSNWHWPCNYFSEWHLDIDHVQWWCLWPCQCCRWGDKNHASLVSLGFVFILKPLLPAGSSQWPSPTMTDCLPWTSQIHHDIIHLPAMFLSPMTTNDSLYLQYCKATSPWRAKSSFQELSKRSQVEYGPNPQKSGQDMGFKISFEPRLVHH